MYATMHKCLSFVSYNLGIDIPFAVYNWLVQSTYSCVKHSGGEGVTIPKEQCLYMNSSPLNIVDSNTISLCILEHMTTLLMSYVPSLFPG